MFINTIIPRESWIKPLSKASKVESLRSFVKWRKQLRILHDALEDAIQELSSVNSRKARRAILELKELKEDVASSLLETAKWSQEDIENLVQRNTVGGYRDEQAMEKEFAIDCTRRAKCEAAFAYFVHSNEAGTRRPQTRVRCYGKRFGCYESDSGKSKARSG